VLNPETPPTPICGVWMTLKPPGSQEKVIFHPRFLGQLGRQVVHHIELNTTLGGLPLSVRMSFTKKTDDRVVYY
jgi:hypothetical protein